MKGRVKVQGVYQEGVNVGLYVLALITLACQLQEADERAACKNSAEVKPAATGTEEVAGD
jgi:hypothetical protein